MFNVLWNLGFLIFDAVFAAYDFEHGAYMLGALMCALAVVMLVYFVRALDRI